MPDASGYPADTSAAPDRGAPEEDAGCEPCESERVLFGGCAGGDLVTPCVDGVFGEPFCLNPDAGLADASTDGAEYDAAADAGYDSGWDAGQFGDSGPDPHSDLYEGTQGLSDADLKDALYEIVKIHTGLGYDAAREVMFSDIDNDDGWVECVYTGKRVETTCIPPSSVMNTEHTWPQSKGASAEPARSDLNHLYPVDSSANSRRSNNDFGWVVDVTWTEGGSKSGTDANGEVVFEPRDQHKGNAARSIFYFSIRYQMPVPRAEEEALKVWNHLDPPDDTEHARNSKIEGYQGTRNPFVDHPEFADRISDF
ncbi:MAG: endonuclease [Deltaproteobacteria bacterium]|nr:endonuclease [Deltaproteobacteria bacterium]